MQCQCSTKKKTTNATIRPKENKKKHYQPKLPRTTSPSTVHPPPHLLLYTSPDHTQPHRLTLFTASSPRARPPPSPEPTLPTPAHPCAQRRRRTFVTTSIAKRLAAACCRASFVAAHLFLVAFSAVRVGYLNWRTAGLRRRPQTPSHCEDGGGARLAPRLALAPAF